MLESAATMRAMRPDPLSPRLLDRPPFGSAGEPATGELSQLERLSAAGLPLAPIVALPAAIEEDFYRLNNLPARIARLFDTVSLHDPDEDDIEEIAPQIRSLLRSHYLLDEVIDAFYEATAALGARLRVRRPGHSGAVATAGRPALLAVKRIWEADWEEEALLARLRGGDGLTPQVRPLLIHSVDEPLSSADLTARIRGVLGGSVDPFGLPDGRLTRIAGAT